MPTKDTRPAQPPESDQYAPFYPSFGPDHDPSDPFGERQPSVPLLLNQLRCNHETLEKNISRLYERLGKVLRQDDEEPIDTAQPGTETPCALAEDLGRECNHVALLNRHLELLLHRLEI